MGCDSFMKVGGFFSTLTLLLAVAYHRYASYVDLSAKIPNILNSLRKAEQKVSKHYITTVCTFLFSLATWKACIKC